MKWLHQLLKALGSLMLLLIDSSKLSDDIFRAFGEEQSRKERQNKPIKLYYIPEDGLLRKCQIWPSKI